jgi:hypothetical protein
MQWIVKTDTVFTIKRYADLIILWYNVSGNTHINEALLLSHTREGKHTNKIENLCITNAVACSCKNCCHKNTTVFSVYHWATSSKFFLSNCDTVPCCICKHVRYDPILLFIPCTVLLQKHVNNEAANNQQWCTLWTLNLHYIHSVPNLHKTFLLLLYVLDVMLPSCWVLLLHNVLNNISLCTSILPL